MWRLRGSLPGRMMGALIAVLTCSLLTAGASPAPRAGVVARPAAVIDPAVNAIEDMSFQSMVTTLSAGPEPGDLALGFADGSAEVIEGGRVTLRLPATLAPVVSVQWMTGSQWVVYGRSSGGHVRYYIVAPSGGAPAALPSCIGASGVDAQWGSLAWWCSDRLYVQGAGMGGPGDTVPGDSMITDRFDLAPLHAPGALQVNWTAGDAAVHYAGGVRIVPLHAAAFAPGSSLSVGGATVMSWSSAYGLGVSWQHGTDLWSAFGTLKQFPAVPGAVRLEWSPDGQFLFVLRQTNHGAGVVPLYEVDRLGWDGSQAVLMHGRLGYVLGFSEGALLLWREEGVAATVYGASGSPGPGPFRLQAVPMPPPPTPAEQPMPALSSMTMASRTVGWGVSANVLVRTEDGGHTWTDITPAGYTVGSVSETPGELPGTVGVGAAGTATLLHAQPCALANCYDAWLYASTTGHPQTSSLWFSSDGGTTWSNLGATGVPMSTFWWRAPLIDFVNAQDGWMLTFPDLNLLATSYDQVYRTTDGGRTWTRAADIYLGPGVPEGVTPVAGGIPFGIGFLTPTTGWITGVGEGTGSVWLLQTVDGGQTWSNVRIPLPVTLGGKGTPTLSRPPQFFGGVSGDLPVVLGGVDNDAAACNDFQCYMGVYAKEVLFRTSDGGVTWEPGTPVGAGGAVAMADASHAWVVNGTRLFSTTDGGATWTARRLDPHLFGLSALTFISAEIGFVSTPGAERGAAVILRTNDGGASWSPILPMLLAAG